MLYFFAGRIVFPGFNAVGYFFGNLCGGKPCCDLLQWNHLNAEDQRKKNSYNFVGLHQVLRNLISSNAAKIGIKY